MKDSQRNLTDLEIEIIDKLLFRREGSRDVFRAHAQEFLCRTLDEYGSIQIFKGVCLFQKSLSGPAAEAMQSDNPAEGTARINYILFAEDGFIRELQIFKDDGSRIETKINPHAFIFV
jgi:hypothetical protein